eukprot:scaffold41028_cov27-Tisochrysis_lutea.AAC.1
MEGLGFRRLGCGCDAYRMSMTVPLLFGRDIRGFLVPYSDSCTPLSHVLTLRNARSCALTLQQRVSISRVAWAHNMLWTFRARLMVRCSWT